MNDKIIQFAQEAALTDGPNGPRYSSSEEFVETFAKLIVNECVGIAEAGLAPAVAAVIKETFGVEEEQG